MAPPHVRQGFFFCPVTDNVAPTVTCPEDRTVETEPGQSYAIVLLFGADSVSTTDALVTIELKGSLYPEYELANLSLADSPHLLRYTATNLINKINATCETYITVRGM